MKIVGVHNSQKPDKTYHAFLTEAVRVPTPEEVPRAYLESSSSLPANGWVIGVINGRPVGPETALEYEQTGYFRRLPESGIEVPLNEGQPYALLSSVVNHKAILDPETLERHAVAAFLVSGKSKITSIDFKDLPFTQPCDDDYFLVIFSSYATSKAWSEEVSEIGYQDLLKTEEWKGGLGKVFLSLVIDHIGLTAMNVAYNAENPEILLRRLKLSEAGLCRNQIKEKLGPAKTEDIRKEFRSLVTERLRDLGRDELASLV